MVAIIPSLFTLGNAVCGFGCITYAAKVGPEAATPNDLYFAALLIFGAMVFDALDGPVARLARQTSAFGAHLDSLERRDQLRRGAGIPDAQVLARLVPSSFGVGDCRPVHVVRGDAAGPFQRGPGRRTGPRVLSRIAFSCGRRHGGIAGGDRTRVWSG